ncbi:hypothetical protein GNI_033510 [Gregarina niphandrodes]|uniref:Uncharacterized protein n=1 Tax=Gregarina niphandrodes TaxID=110365 RepID=A0A023BAV0_GRENI|nr:hypothetical protein GNI_033510 [Gregarina niphandrodes]EZG78663.1 hypothetical protein GNI_033510 [Gregarina niphandrodes]|eukprot:XP_011129214.1 hypothetical protein GNI_033510 [Gregarina niphandrodes]
MGCGNDSSEFDQYFYCCKLLKTFEGFISHCHSRHWGPKNSAGVLSCDCGRFRGNYESYLDHLEILGDYWYCEDCDEYSHDCPDCLKEHTVRHALHEEVLEHQNQLAKKKLMKTHKELRLLDEEVVTLRKEKRALETKVNELLGTNDELLTQLAAFTKLPAVGCGVTRDSTPEAALEEVATTAPEAALEEVATTAPEAAPEEVACTAPEELATTAPEVATQMDGVIVAPLQLTVEEEQHGEQ